MRKVPYTSVMKHFLILALCCFTLARSQDTYIADGVAPVIRHYPPNGNDQYPQLVHVVAQPTQQIQRIKGASDQRFEAITGQYPYQVAIQVDGEHHCGGSLISKKHVLTAAHCTNDWIKKRRNLSTIKVIVGTNNLDNGGTVMNVARVKQHPFFGQESATSLILINDIAVITLTQEIKESSTVKIIKLPPPGLELANHTRLIVSGFGSTQTGGPASRKLRHLYMFLVDLSACAISWSFHGSISVGHICAALSRGYGTCHGDSGGPLVLDDRSTVVGIVSEGIGFGCDSGWPDLYTKVSYYIDFINSELALTG